jgi:hypothetical protein
MTNSGLFRNWEEMRKAHCGQDLFEPMFLSPRILAAFTSNILMCLKRQHPTVYCQRLPNRRRSGPEAEKVKEGNCIMNCPRPRTTSK